MARRFDAVGFTRFSFREQTWNSLIFYAVLPDPDPLRAPLHHITIIQRGCETREDLADEMAGEELEGRVLRAARQRLTLELNRVLRTPGAGKWVLR